MEASGAHVHVFTSPHLVRFNERIVVAGAELSDAALLHYFSECASHADEKLTYFELVACAAFLAFAQSNADFTIVEVGLGGRLDATNVFSSPIATVITPIDFDHQHYLGDTLSLIAAEKAGIMRRGAPAVIGRQSAEAAQTLSAHAERIGARPVRFGQEWSAFIENGRLIYQDDSGLSDLSAPSLYGDHQFDNAGLAVASLKAAGTGLSDDVFSRGVANAQWPARMQRLRSGPIVDFLTTAFGNDTEVWLDGGHNPHAGRAVAHALAGLEEKRQATLTLIAGMQAKKDAPGFFSAFKGLVKTVYTVAADKGGVMSADAVATAAQDAGLDATPCQSLNDALALAVAGAADIKEPQRVLICGSLYLAGEILKDNA